MPVLPPNKRDVDKYLSTASKSSKSVQKVQVGIKMKIKSIISQSLSPVHEMIQLEPTTDSSNDNRVADTTTNTISSQQSSDFEMIDEWNLPVLSEAMNEAVTEDANLMIARQTGDVKQSDVLHITDEMMVDEEPTKSPQEEQLVKYTTPSEQAQHIRETDRHSTNNDESSNL